MEIPYTVSARRDTGLWNAKVGIWLFLASEVMLFGGLFSAYIFLRLDAGPGAWPHGLLKVPVGTMNTAILIASSVTAVLAWATLKMRDLTKYRIYMAITILCGVVFIVVTLPYHRLARRARPRWRARFLLHDAAGQHPHLSAQPRTFGQSGGSGRPFLALRRSGLDLRVSALLSSLTMNNPPDISPVEHETEEYAHEVRRHVRGFLLVGSTLLALSAITDDLAYDN